MVVIITAIEMKAKREMKKKTYKERRNIQSKFWLNGSLKVLQLY